MDNNSNMANLDDTMATISCNNLKLGLDRSDYQIMVVVSTSFREDNNGVLKAAPGGLLRRGPLTGSRFRSSMFKGADLLRRSAIMDDEAPMLLTNGWY
jgi:hypothetical protein